MKKIYEEITSLAPTCEEIEDFIDSAGKSHFVTFTKEDEPLSVKLNDHTHIDVTSCNFHLMLDEVIAPVFLDFLRRKRKEEQD